MKVIKYLLVYYKNFCFGGWPSISMTKTKRIEEEEESSNWDKLPKEILKSIFDRLDLVDRIRFNLVCKGWKTDTSTKASPLWLMLPPDDKYCRCLSFFDAGEGKVRKINLPKSAQGGWFYGCNHGWLFMATRFGDDPQVFLFDPISRVQIPLPPLSTISISDFEYSFSADRSNWNAAACIIDNVVVSSSDASQCIVAATIRDDGRILALCRPGDERWTVFKTPIADENNEDEDYEYMFSSPLFSDGGKTLNVCVVNDIGFDAFQTHSITLSRGDRVNLRLIPFPSTDEPDLFFDIEDLKHTYSFPYLVESDGQILMIIRIIGVIGLEEYKYLSDEDVEEDWSDHEDANVDDDLNEHLPYADDSDLNEDLPYVDDDDDDDDDLDGDTISLAYHSSVRFQVWKIEVSGDQYAATRRLSSVGNQTLFIGGGVSNQERNSKIWDKNCIYFIEGADFVSDDGDNEYPLSRDSGVYYLDDESIKRPFPSVRIDKGCSMSWFSPNIKVGAFHN